jgi:hypothetical protein
MNPVLKDLNELIEAVLKYDRAIQDCAGDPKRMSSYCTARGEDLESLYLAWLILAQELKKKYSREGVF